MDLKHSSFFLGEGEVQGQSKTARSGPAAPGDPAMSIGLHPGLARRPHAAAVIQAVTRFVISHSKHVAKKSIDFWASGYVTTP
jgi:hypothetical protein